MRYEYESSGPENNATEQLEELFILAHPLVAYVAQV